MRILKIVLNDIKKFLSQKTCIFFILMLSLIITSFTFSLFVSDRMQVANLVNMSRNVTNKYFIGNINGINDEEIINLDNWLQENEFTGYIINLYSDILLNSSIDEIIFQQQEIPKDELAEGAVSGTYVQRIEGIVDKPYSIIIGTNNNDKKQYGFIGSPICEDDIKNSSNYIMIDYNSSMGKKNSFILNELLTIRDKEYIVKAIGGVQIYPEVYEFCNTYNYNKGTLLNLEPVVIPITTFLNNNMMICGIDVIIPDNITEEKKEAFDKFILTTFSESKILEPKRIEASQLSDISRYLILFSTLIVLALINILALFSYWVDNNWRKYMIYRICGANKKDIFKIILLEAIIIGVISIFIGNVLYYTQAILFNSMILSLKDICIFQFIILFLITILTSIEGLKLLKINPRYMGRR